MSSTTIKIEQITKAFPSFGAAASQGQMTRAVDDVSFDIQAGELFFLLGPSGCGKTTLLRMIAGFIEPTNGRILFASGGTEQDVTYLAPNKRNTGMVFQSYALWPHMTIEQNVAFGLDVRGVSGKELQERVRAALATVRMEQYSERKPNQLSGGQQQRIALARALVIRPSVLLLDEPLSNLDAKLRNELRSEIRRVCKESGITTVYVTHDQKEALSMADRVAIMRAGKVVQMDTPRALYRAPHSRFVAQFLGDTNLVPGVVTSLQTNSASIDVAGGSLQSNNVPRGTQVGQRVLVSVRPESLVVTPDGTLRGNITESVYLGDTEQLHGSLPDGTRIVSSKTNPGSASVSQQTCTWRVAPEDTVILADEGPVDNGT